MFVVYPVLRHFSTDVGSGPLRVNRCRREANYEEMAKDTVSDVLDFSYLSLRRSFSEFAGQIVSTKNSVDSRRILDNFRLEKLSGRAISILTEERGGGERF